MHSMSPDGRAWPDAAHALRSALLCVATATVATTLTAQAKFEWLRLPPEQLSQHAAAYDDVSGITWVHGGVDRGRTRDDLWRWDGTSWQRAAIGGPGALHDHAMAYDITRGTTILFGGLREGAPTGETWEWNGTTWRRLQPARSPGARSGHAMTFDAARQRIVLFGGQDASTRLADTWEWDGTSWIPIAASGAPSARSHHAMAYHAGLRRVLLFGGQTGSAESSELHSFDGAGWAIVTGVGVSPRARAAFAYDAMSNALVLYGGTSSGVDLADCHSWTSTAGWKPISAPTTKPIAGRTAVHDSRRNVVVLIGWSQTTPDAEVWEWNGTAWSTRGSGSWTHPAPRLHAGFRWHSVRGEGLLFGGMPADARELNDTWRWTGHGWQLAQPTTSPSARRSFGFAEDVARGELVLFGGFGGNVTNAETWIWNGTDWTRRFPLQSPKHREQPMMAAEPWAGRIVLFSGKDYLGVFTNDSWTWNGSNWMQHDLTSTPIARADGILVSNPLAQNLVLFGGGSYGGSDLFDTWEWRAGQWRQFEPQLPRPAPRRHHSGTFHPRLNRVLLHAGTVSHFDTWTWRGTRWEELPVGPTSSRFGRIGCALAFDPERNRLVRFGGRDDLQGIHGDTWELVAPSPISAHFPREADTTEGSAALSFPFSVAQGRSQFLLMSRAFSALPTGLVNAVELRRDAGQQVQPARQLDAEVWIGVAATTAATMATTAADNYLGTPVRIFSGRLSLPRNEPTLGPAPFAIRIPATSGQFLWNGQDLALEFAVQNNTLTGDYEIDAWSTPRNAGTATPFGQACAGKNGNPQLHFFVPQYLHAGGVLVTQATGLAPQTLAFAHLGTSTSEWSGLPLPFTWPQSSCTLYTGAEQMQWTAADATGTATSVWILPPDPRLVGATRYLQWAAVEPQSAYPPFIHSQAARLTFAVQQADFETIANFDLGPFGLKDPARHVGPVIRLIVE